MKLVLPVRAAAVEAADDRAAVAEAAMVVAVVADGPAVVVAEAAVAEAGIVTAVIAVGAGIAAGKRVTQYSSHNKTGELRGSPVFFCGLSHCMKSWNIL